MSQNSCCVPGCLTTRKDGIPLHWFPHPENNADKFKTWIMNIGGALATLDHTTVYNNRRVCHKHFQEIHKYPRNKLSALATPVLHMPEQSVIQNIALEPSLPSVSDVLMPGPSTMAAGTRHALLTSDLQEAQISDDLILEMGAMDIKCTETADLLMFFDNLFDSVNSSFSGVKNGKVYRAAVTPTSPHHKLWDDSIPVLKSMRFLNGQGVVPSLSSWIKTVESFKRIVSYLNNKGINSLLLRNFNQDALENFFGAVRAHGCSNTMPTATAFEGAFKTLLINNISSSHSVGSNCEKDNSVCLQSLKYFLAEPGDHSIPECEDEIDNDHLYMQLLNTEDLISSQSPMLIERCAAVAYCSGWIAQLAKKNIYKNCVACKNDLEEEQMQSFHKFIKKKEYDNKKWLCYPTRALFDFFAQVENICIEILKEHADKKNLINYIKLIINLNLETTFIKCPIHKESLAKYLINKCTMFFVNNWCKEINSLLTGKVTFWDVNDPLKEKANRHYSKHKGRKRKQKR